MSRKNILIVDTDKAFLNRLHQNFLSHKAIYQVAYCSTTAKATEILGKFKVHLVLTNVHLAGESGIELLLNIRRCHQGTHVILYCQDLLEELKRAAFYSGATAVLNQSFQFAELLDILGTVFREEEGGAFFDSVPLSDLLQLYAMGEQSSEITVNTPSSPKGSICLHNGLLTEAKVGDKRGVEAIAEMLSWQDLTIRTNRHHAEKPQDTTGEPMMQILLQAAALIDEA